MKKNFLSLTILIALVLAYFASGNIPNKLPVYITISTLCFITIFFIKGWQLCPKSLSDMIQQKKIIFFTIISAFILCPLITFGLVNLFLQSNHPITIGLILISCMPPTVVSGVVLTKTFGGNHTLAITLTVLLTLIGIFIIPFILKVFLGKSIALDVSLILNKLIFLILVPTLLGVGARKLINFQSDKLDKFLFFIPLALFGILVFLSFLPYVDFLNKFSLSLLLKSIFLALLCHQVCILGNFFIFYKMTKSYSTSLPVTICSSQKTLPLAITIWVNFFAENYPLVILVLVIFHSLQLYSDSIILRWVQKQYN